MTKVQLINRMSAAQNQVFDLRKKFKDLENFVNDKFEETEDHEREIAYATVLAKIEKLKKEKK